MNIFVEKLPQCRVNMRVELTKEEVEARRREIVQAFRSQARIQGYRPGKAPLPIIEKRYQKEISEELETRLVRFGCQEGIEKESIEVIAVTGIQDTAHHPDQTFSFTAHLQIAPDFDLPAYLGIPIHLARIDITTENVERTMDALREKLSSFEDIADRPLAMGDVAAIDFTGTLDGQPIDEVIEGTGFLARGTGQWLRLDPSSLIPGFCDALAGASAGDTKSFDLTVDENFPLESLHGKTLHYEVAVKSGKEQVLPEWTEELAATFGEGLTVETLRDACRTKLQAEMDNRRQQEITTQILEFLDQHVDFELPNHILARETQRQVNQIVRHSHQRGISEEEITGQRDAIIQHASNQAEVNVKTSFILSQIAEREKIIASEEDLAAYCVAYAKAAGVPLKRYLRQLQKSDALSAIVEGIVRSKTLAFLREKAAITESDPSSTPPTETPE